MDTCHVCFDRGIHVWVPFPLVSENPFIQEEYLLSRFEGTSHSLAEMFAFRQPPMSNTDREFLQGHCNGNQFEGQDYVANLYRRRALAAGVDPLGKVYKPSLARYPGDPQAWVSGRADVQRICETNGWGCEGSVNVPVREVAPRGTGRLADDIVQDKVAEILEQTPEPERVDTADLASQVREKMTPHWVKEPHAEGGS
jgi:hypothetical protein